MSELLFVYGTLKPGHGNHRRIADYVRSIRPGKVHGILVDLGAFPALLHGVGRVNGVLLDVDAEAISVTDIIEGCHGDGGRSLYLREKTDVELDDGEVVESWTYFFGNPSSINNRPRLVVGQIDDVSVFAWQPWDHDAFMRPSSPNRKNRSKNMISFQSPGSEFKLFGVYHHHEYGGNIHFVWADHDPTEQEVVATCGLEFEPDRDEWIVVKPVNEATTIRAS